MDISHLHDELFHTKVLNLLSTFSGKDHDALKIKWSENFSENYVEVQSGKSVKKIAVTPEQKELLKKRAKGETEYVITPKYSKESSIIPEKDGPLPGFRIPAKETTIVIKPVYDVPGLMGYMTIPKNLLISRDEHSVVFEYRPNFLKKLKRRNHNG